MKQQIKIINGVEIPEKVVKLFIEYAFMVKNAGHSKYSAWAIINQIRWHEQIDQGNRLFKCSNHWMAPLARWAMNEYDELDGFFRIRPTNEEKNMNTV